MIDEDEMVDMCFDLLSEAKNARVRNIIFKPRKRNLFDCLMHALQTQEFVVKGLPPEYDRTGVTYPLVVDVYESYFGDSA